MYYGHIMIHVTNENKKEQVRQVYIDVEIVGVLLNM